MLQSFFKVMSTCVSIHDYSLEIIWIVCALITWFAWTHVYWYMASCLLLGVWLYRWVYNIWIEHTTPPTQKNDCPICMESIDSDSFVWCSQCRYTFHKECYTKWRDVNTNCPMCRQEYGVVTQHTWPITSFSQLYKVATIATLLLSILPGLYLILLPCLFVLHTMFKNKI